MDDAFRSGWIRVPLELKEAGGVPGVTADDPQAGQVVVVGGTGWRGRGGEEQGDRDRHGACAGTDHGPNSPAAVPLEAELEALDVVAGLVVSAGGSGAGSV